VKSVADSGPGSGVLLAVALDGHAAAHLLAAIRGHRRFARTQGYAIPAALQQLERIALPPLNRQEPTATDRRRH
jgi:hypothetical protein